MAIIFLSYRDTDRLHVRRISCTEWRIRLKFFVEVRIWIQFYWRVGSGSSVFGGSDRYRIFFEPSDPEPAFLEDWTRSTFLGKWVGSVFSFSAFFLLWINFEGRIRIFFLGGSWIRINFLGVLYPNFYGGSDLDPCF